MKNITPGQMALIVAFLVGMSLIYSRYTRESIEMDGATYLFAGVMENKTEGGNTIYIPIYRRK